MIKPRVTFKERDFVKEDSVTVGRKIITRRAKELAEKGQADFSEAFNVDDLTDQDVQDFIGFEKGDFQITELQDRVKNFVGEPNVSQKELLDYMGKVLRGELLDRR